MYLKRISLLGFKSFPDKVVFDFSPGVTCVVGPNGCGKSNLVDAFKWVLGEQSAKLLRGRQMTDMIFNGSATRRGSGMAQIGLLFDNADRVLPMDRDEVSVTRRLYRSGESEYLINNQVARLKDVRELFLDTGIGADSYSVIEQGRVGRLLDASNVDRRAIFEEAAGIARYKARKREAERKLERTEQNVLRVTDIIEEVQRRLRSVKVQAGKARRYQECDARLRELRAWFSLAEYRRHSDAIDRLRRQFEDARDESTAIRTQIDRSEAESASLSEVINHLTEELSQTEQQFMQTRSDIATHEERIAAAEKRIGEQQSNLQRSGNRLEQLRQQRDQYEVRLAEVQQTAVALQEQTHEHEGRIRALTEEERSLGEGLSESRARLEDEKAGLVDLMRRSTQLRNEIQSLNTHRQKLESEHHRLGRRDAAIRAELQEYLTQRSELNARVGEIDALVEAEMTVLRAKGEDRARQARLRDQVVQSLGSAREERSGLRSRLHLLDELQRKMEGVGAGVRSLLELKLAKPDDQALAGLRGLVGEMFDAEVVHAGIIEAAIGELDQFLVLASGDMLLTHRELFEDLPGRLTAICLDRLPPVINEPVHPDHPCIVANAADLVRYEEGCERLARHLLGKTVVVDTLENALVLAKADPAERRFVTLKGEVVEPNGCVSVGPPGSRAGLIARKSERRKVEAELNATEADVTALIEQLEQIDREAEHLDKVCQQLREAIEQANAAKVEAAASLERVNEAVRRLSEEQPMIAGEVTLIEQQIAEARRRASESAESASRLEAENKRREQTVAGYAEQIERLNDQRERVQFALTEARIAVGKLTEKRKSIADNIGELRRAIRTTSEAVESTEQEHDDARSRISDSHEAIVTARARLEELAVTGERLEATIIQLRRRREMVHLESEQLAAKTKGARTRLEEVESRVHHLDLQMQNVVVHRDELLGRVRDELNLDLVELSQSCETSDRDMEAVEAEIAELRQKIERLGNVNLDAINELAELEERDSFLTSQYQDLQDSRGQLEALIRKLDAESRERFTKAFEAIRENFRTLFRKLFGGGKADIVLEDPDAPLDCGIEVLAKPPGKELQRISLMSGGEKTLTAIALVMSIFRAQPSPFAFLDEVDAALDEANNVRFNNILREFLDKSQFIVVTHSKRTMSIADQLYGITMQEPGVSSRVSVKFEEERPAETHAVA